MSHPNLMNTYAPLDVTFTHGEGLRVYDTNGKSYLDALSGIATCNLGHAHPAVTQTISEQASKLIHCSNIYRIAPQEQLAEKLCTVANMEKVFFCNSGAEANEAAIKLARKHANKSDLSNAKVIVLESSFHGRTIATLSASANKKIHAGFEPVLDDFIRLPINDLDAIAKTLESHTISAVMLEPTQGEGGIHLMSADYLRGIQALCKTHKALFILDEIQSGNGRTGSYFAYQQFDLTPDVVTTAKGLGNGFPIGACLAQGYAATLFEPGNHGSTFGGNPLACATALTVVNTICNDGLAENAKTMGAYLVEQFSTALQGVDGIADIRGHGLMIGIELNKDCPELVKIALDAGLLINVTAGKVIRLLPALIITQDEADELVNTLTPLIKDFL